MKNRKTAWDDVFKDKGQFFCDPHPDIDIFVDFLKKAKAKNILDFGCGTGRHTVYLSRNGFNVVGMDISETGIKMTGDWLAKENLHADLLIRDMAKLLPFPDNYFDGVISTQVINHGDKQTIEKIIQEITRVTKPGGIIFITVSIFEKNPSFGVSKEKKEIAERTFIPLSGLEKGLIHYFFTVDEFVNSFPGFKILKSFMDKTHHYALIARKQT